MAFSLGRRILRRPRARELVNSHLALDRSHYRAYRIDHIRRPDDKSADLAAIALCAGSRVGSSI